MADKSFEWRMQGMVYACKMAKENGIEYLEKDIKRRGVLKADIIYKEKQLRELWDNLSKNLYTNMLVTVLWVLHDKYGFRKERLKKFRGYYDEAVRNTLDLDFMGEHYVKMQDYAVELNEQYKMDLDVNLVAFCEDSFDEKNPNYRDYEYVDGIIRTLRIAGYEDAAQFLEDKKAKE